MADERKGGRWIRLDTTWSSSEWVANLSPEPRLCWVELLCYVKAHGYAGRVKSLTPTVAARLWGVTRNAVVTMIEAAEADQALATEGDEWIVTSWDTYQPDRSAPHRQRRYRERQQAVAPLPTPVPVTAVTRNARIVTHTETETETEQKELPPLEGGANENTVVVSDWRSTTPGTWTGGHVVAAYIEYCHRKGIPEPPPAARGKQGAVGKRLAERYAPSDIVRAMVGIGTLYPHSAGEPWDLFVLEKKFTMAYQAAANEPTLREAAFDEAFMRGAT